MNIVFEGKTKNNKPLLIRYPTLDDAQIMTNYMNEISKEKTYISWQGEVLTLEEEQKNLEEFIENIHNKKIIFLLAFMDGALIGISNITQMKRVCSHIGEMGISIAKEYRGEGIGNIFITSLLAETKKHISQITMIILYVFALNEPAINLYKKFGFEQHGILHGGVQYKGELIDLLYMHKKLS